MTTRFSLAFDRSASARRVDENGYLHVASSHITKATVNPYYGAEIPGWEAAGLEPQKVYYGFRDPQELQKSLPTWAGLPLHIEHHVDSADDPQKLTRVGSVGTDVRWNAPYVDAPLTVWDRQAITGIEDGSFRELSCAYRYTPDFTPGEYERTPYDFVMRDIRGNHVALVEEGRAGPDVVVADRKTVNNPQQSHGGIMQGIKRFFRGAQDGDPTVEQQEVDLAQAIIDLHKLDPRTGEILDITEDEDKEKEIRKLLGEMEGKLDPEQLKKLRDALADLAYSKPTGDDADGSKEFAEGVKYGEKMEKKEPEKLEREHESEGERKALGEDEDGDNAEGTAQDRSLRRGPRPLTAADAQRIRAEAAADARDHIQALYRAVETVRPLVGQLDAMSFDSAGDVYAHTLKGCGLNPSAYPRASWRGMVDVLLKQRRENAAAAFMAQDAGLPGKMDGAFAGLNNIVLS